MKFLKKIIFFSTFYVLVTNLCFADSHNFQEILDLIQKDIKTLEKAVYSENFKSAEKKDQDNTFSNELGSEDALTRHLLKLSEIENQFQRLTNNFEEMNFKLDKLSSRLSKIQADNQLRLQKIEKTINKNISLEAEKLTSNSPSDFESQDIILPGSTEPQDLGSVSYKDMGSESELQQTQSIDTTSSVVTENFFAEEKILPEVSPEKQYEFATSFLKIGDYNTAERAFREFVKSNSNHELAGNAQYWYAETFRIRQLYTDAASAYLEGYQTYPESEKAPINLLKLGISLVQIGEKDQGCLMIKGVKKQYPDAKESVIQKAKYEEKKFGCPIKKT